MWAYNGNQWLQWYTLCFTVYPDDFEAKGCRIVGRFEIKYEIDVKPKRQLWNCIYLNPGAIQMRSYQLSVSLVYITW